MARAALMCSAVPLAVAIPAALAFSPYAGPGGALWTDDGRIEIGGFIPAWVTPYVLGEDCQWVALLEGAPGPPGVASYSVPDAERLSSLRNPYVFAPDPTPLHREGYARAAVWDPPEKCAATYAVLGSAERRVLAAVAVDVWERANPIFEVAEAAEDADVVMDLEGIRPDSLEAAVGDILDGALLGRAPAAAPAGGPGPHAEDALRAAEDSLGSGASVTYIEAFGAGNSSYLAVAEEARPRVHIFDITNVTAPEAVASMATEQFPAGIEARGGLLYVLDWGRSVYIYDVADPRAAALLSTLSPESGFPLLDAPAALEVATVGNSTYALVASMGNNSIIIADVTDPARPAPAGAIVGGSGGFPKMDGLSAVAAVTFNASTYMLATWDGGVVIADVSDPASPRRLPFVMHGESRDIGSVDPTHMAAYRTGNSTFAVVASFYNNALQVLNVTDPERMVAAAFVTAEDEGFDAMYWPGRLAIGGDAMIVVSSLWGDATAVSLADPRDPEPLPYAALDGFEVRDAAFGHLGDTPYAAFATTAGVVLLPPP